jgi:hypothetical protein
VGDSAGVGGCVLPDSPVWAAEGSSLQALQRGVAVLGVPAEPQAQERVELLVSRVLRRVKPAVAAGASRAQATRAIVEAEVCGMRRRVRGSEGQADLLEALQRPKVRAAASGGDAGEAAAEVSAPQSSLTSPGRGLNGAANNALTPQSFRYPPRFLMEPRAAPALSSGEFAVSQETARAPIGRRDRGSASCVLPAQSPGGSTPRILRQLAQATRIMPPTRV